MSSKKFRLMFYTDERDRAPVEEALSALPMLTQTKMLSVLEQLFNTGISARCQHVIGTLFYTNVTASSARDIIIFYAFFRSKYIVLTHVSRGKPHSQPAAPDVRVALERYRAFIVRHKKYVNI